MRSKKWVEHLLDKFGERLIGFSNSSQPCPCIYLDKACRFCKDSYDLFVPPYLSCEPAKEWMKVSGRKRLKIKRKIKKRFKI